MCNLNLVTSIRCFTDNQGIPVEEAPFIIPRFKAGFKVQSKTHILILFHMSLTADLVEGHRKLTENYERIRWVDAHL